MFAEIEAKWEAEEKAAAAAAGEPEAEPEPTPYESAFAAWEAALALEGVPMSADDMLRQWPTMLVRSPAGMPTVMAVLRAAVPDANAVVAASPSLLAASPLQLQTRLVQLHLAAEGELPGMLAAEPRLLTRPPHAILSNLRAVRALSRSSREFRSFLRTDPEALCARPGKVRAGAAAATRAVRRALPSGVDPAAVIAAKPQLALVRGSWLAQRWRGLCAEAEAVDEWQRQLDSLVAAAAGEGPVETVEGGVPSAPAWIHASTDPKALGIVAEEEDAAADADGDGDEPVLSEAEHRSRRAYSALGEALLMKPWRVQRLQYLVEAEGPEGAGAVSLIGALTVQLEQFLEAYPGFEEWLQEREAAAEEEDRWQRRQGRHGGDGGDFDPVA